MWANQLEVFHQMLHCKSHIEFSFASVIIPASFILNKNCIEIVVSQTNFMAKAYASCKNNFFVRNFLPLFMILT